jgi:hypothetical protein
LVGYRKVYSVRCEADVVMTSVIHANKGKGNPLPDREKRTSHV